MSFVTVLSNDNIVLAFVLFGLCATTFPLCEFYLRKKFDALASRSPLWFDRGAAFGRAIIVGGFVYFCYPTMFGLSVAPTLEYLKRNSDAQFGIDFAFAAVVAISIFATSGTRWKFTLPFQACFATTYLFFELTRYLGVTTASPWPGLNVVLTVSLVAYVADRFASSVSMAGDQWFTAKFGSRGYHAAIGQIFGMLAQAPIILLFAYGLGRQLAI
ncbi:MAG: hypothetical protein ACI9BW_000542 [Gammaproteobacteria bacterium]